MKQFFKNKRFLALVCAVCILAATMFTVGDTLAKYVTNRQSQDLITAREFRFESNYLEEGGETYTIYADTVSFNVANTDGLTRTADVTYTLTISGGRLTNGTDGDHTFGNTTGHHSYTLDRTGSNGEAADQVTVTATSTAPYSKTISATFQFKNPEAYYTVTNGTRYVQIDVYTADAVTGITVSGTEGLTPDATNANFSGSNIGALDADSHYTFVYFKNAEKGFMNVEKTALTGTITLR